MSSAENITQSAKRCKNIFLTEKDYFALHSDIQNVLQKKKIYLLLNIFSVFSFFFFFFFFVTL